MKVLSSAGELNRRTGCQPGLQNMSSTLRRLTHAAYLRVGHIDPLHGHSYIVSPSRKIHQEFRSLGMNPSITPRSVCWFFADKLTSPSLGAAYHKRWLSGAAGFLR